MPKMFVFLQLNLGQSVYEIAGLIIIQGKRYSQ